MDYESNFIELLTLRSNDVPAPKKWMKLGNNWWSNHLQTEFFCFFAEALQNEVMDTVKSKKIFNCLADDTQNITTQEQLYLLFFTLLKVTFKVVTCLLIS